ncbi:MAG: VOC family protein [Deltaproteobacteria bacterium]|nr:VOC family protein [Deltaproteobacteria bacterium]
MRLRQIALVASELDPVVERLCAVLGIDVGFNDPGVREFGLVNAVMPIGDTFLEVVVPNREGTTAGRLIERRSGDGGYMVIVQSQARDEDRKRVDALGVRVVWEASLSDAHAIHLHPRDVGGAILSLDWMDPPSSWRWGGPDWQAKVRTDVAREIVGADVQAEDPGAMAARWAEVMAQKAPTEEGGGFRIDLDEGGFVRFHPPRDERGEGVSGFTVAAADPDHLRSEAQKLDCVNDAGEINICGVRIGIA